MPGAYTDQLLTTLVSANGTAGAKVGGAAGGGLNFVAPLTVTPTSAGADIGLGTGNGPPIYYSGTVTTTDGTTTKNIVTFAIPTGFDAWVEITFSAKLSGNTYITEAREFFHNPSGTPTVSGGTWTPSGKTVMEDDETSGAFTGSAAVLGRTFAANAVTYTATGAAATTIKWTMSVAVRLIAE